MSHHHPDVQNDSTFRTDSDISSGALVADESQFWTHRVCHGQLLHRVQQSSKAMEEERKRVAKLAATRAAKVAKTAGSRRSRSPSEQRQGQPSRKRRRNPTPAAQVEMGQLAVHRVVGELYDIHDRNMRRRRRRVLTRREAAEKAQETERSTGDSSGPS